MGEFISTSIRDFFNRLLNSRLSLVLYVGLKWIIGSLAAERTNTPAVYWAACASLSAIAVFLRIRLSRRKRDQHYRP
ncbi:hypothetical protein ASG68_28775 [Rhizobium sp. Leaf453]|nr:hypothetical protein ASG50_25695 [Rhizobium sp. Leaf386]KQS95636.1 hypothetical protein ASG42_29430 [Rhizobium sp. Leaf391]KQU01863.1 hypothetical protein ASG68_28775 [Rhizobium sp. Leaf453]